MIQWFNKVDSTTMYVDKLASNLPNGMVLNSLGLFNIRLQPYKVIS